MKLKFLKTAFATACVVAAGMGCFKAYTASNQSESSMLLAENVEALSKEDGDLRSMQNTSRYIQTSRGILITNITGSIEASVNLGLSIGKLIDGGLLQVAQGAGLNITVKDVKTYKESCFYKKGASCPCIETDWRPCEGSCPKSCG